MNNIFDTVIIGAGPAGMAVALNMLRFGRNVIILEKENVGGQIAKSPKIENFPSIKSIKGSEFVRLFESQLEDFSKDIIKFEEVLDIKKDNENFYIKTDINNYVAKTVVIAMGLRERKINIPNEEKLIGHGISYCVMCDGIFFKNKDVCIIGGGNTAFQYALVLSNYCKNVYLYELKKNFLADNCLIQEAKNKKNIFLKSGFLIKEVIEDKENNCLKEIIFSNLSNKKDEHLSVQGLFVAIGQMANNNIFKNSILLNKDGFIKTNEKMNVLDKENNEISGLFSVGDCREKRVRQLGTAIGDASVASFFINEYLKFI